MANFWFKFEWDAWRNDRQLRRCSKEARGFWIDCIAAMEELGTYFLEGTPDEICREVVADRGEFDRSIAELSRHEAATVEKSQGVVKIISRRLLKKANLTEYNRLKQREHRGQLVVNDESNEPSKELESESSRTLDSSPIGEEVNTPPDKPEPKILLPINFQISDDMRAWAVKETPSVRIDSELEEFVTFWRDIATKNNKRTMRGWNATWKKRMRDLQAEASKSNGRTNGYRPFDAGKPQAIETQFTCKKCLDTGEVTQKPRNAKYDWELEAVPCPDCKLEKAA